MLLLSSGFFKLHFPFVSSTGPYGGGFTSMKIWDWHYRVYFNESLRNEVLQWSGKLTAEEQRIMQDTLAFYTSFYSFGILFDLIEEDPVNCSELLTIAEARLDEIISLPSLLVEHYREKIALLPITESEKQRLLALLAIAQNGREIRDQYWSYIRNLLGSSYEKILRAFSDDCYASYKPVPAQSKIKTDFMHRYSQINKRLTEDPDLLASYGNFAIQNINIRIEEGIGYGEWWDHELTGGDHDELILYKSDCSVNDMDYLYTIIHEVYPGHGHFYNLTRDTHYPLDHGAMMLVEGWATFCEMNTLPSEYISAIRHNYLVLLHNSYFCGHNELAEIIWENKRRQNVPFRHAFQSLVYVTQYVGYLQSYYLGALWLELAIGTNKYPTPKEFLHSIRGRNKGDFFRLWL